MNVLKPFGKFDVLFYYTKLSSFLKDFLKNKEIATKIWIPSSIGFFIRRGSKDEPLFINEFSNLDNNFFKLRSEMKREDALSRINKTQAKIWLYFPPNKCIDFFYACNNEGQGKKIDRIFIDVDRTNLSSDKALEVTKELIEVIKKDDDFNKLLNFKIKILWTGSSFHVYLMLNKKITSEFYNKFLAYSKNDSHSSFIKKWSEQISKKLRINVSGGHEKLKDIIILDPSGTPSGKLARVPFSLHYIKPANKNEKSIDGICVPLNEKQLSDKNLIKKLKSLTPEQVLKNVDFWKKNL